MPIPLSQRPWLVRFAWGGVVVLFLLTGVVVYVFWCHESGMADFRRVQESHVKEGRGATFQHLVADIPESDPDRHARWWRWQGAMASHTHQIGRFLEAWDSDEAWKWRLGLSTDSPASLRDAFSEVAGFVSEVESLLDTGPFIAGMAGNLRSTLRPDDPVWLTGAFSQFQSDAYGQKPDAPLHLLDIRAVQFAVSALGYRVLSSDPGSPLRRMDQLVVVLSHPLGLYETLCLQLAVKRRDEIYLAATLRGSLLTEEAFAAWLADGRGSRSLEEIAKGFRAERIMRTGCLEPIVQAGGLHHLEYYGRQMIPRPVGWMYGSPALALCSETISDIERRIERGPGYFLDMDRWARSATLNPAARTIIPNLFEAAITAAESRLVAHRTRIIAVIVRHAMRSGLPADHTALRSLLGERASWLDAGDDRCAMVYTRLADDRFVIGVDLAKSRNGAFTPLDRYRSLAKSHGYYTTPSPTDLPPRPRSPMADIEIWIPAKLALPRE